MPLNPIEGTNGPDTRFGGASNDLIHGYRNADTLYGGDGADLILGGSGNDVLAGGNGNDRLLGEDGDDILASDSGDDRMFGGAGNDRFFNYGATGADSAWGGDGNDYLFWGTRSGGMFHGGRGLDHLSFQAMTAGAVQVDLSTGGGVLAHGGGTLALTLVERLTLLLGAADDTVTGGRFGDTLNVGAGANVVDAGAGNDTVTFVSGAASTLEGGAGNDRLIVLGPYLAGHAFTADGSVDDGFGSQITGFERFHLQGGIGTDTLTGGSDRDTLYGSGNTDRLDGGGGNDLLFGQAGADQASGGAGDDTISGGRGLDVLTGGDGGDTFVFAVADGSGDEITDFSPGQDVLRVVGHAFGIAGGTPVVLSLDTAASAAAQFVFDTSNGQLWWDGDGAGASAGRILAVLHGDLVLTASDIVLT